MAYHYETVKLEKGMYGQSGCTFAQTLEKLDPSEHYRGTPLEGMDAFQRQLKRFDIKVKGAGSDHVEKFFHTSDSSVLFPEFVSRVVRQGLEEESILPNITATVTHFDGMDYGVLTEVLVIDKTRNTSYSVKNQKMIDRGGQCRRVLYTPGQSTWASMRYTGEYQIARSAEDAWAMTLCLPESFSAFPGDVVQLQLERLGFSGTYRVSEAESTFSASGGARTTLTLKERT